MIASVSPQLARKNNESLAALLPAVGYCCLHGHQKSERERHYCRKIALCGFHTR